MYVWLEGRMHYDSVPQLTGAVACLACDITYDNKDAWKHAHMELAGISESDLIKDSMGRYNLSNDFVTSKFAPGATTVIPGASPDAPMTVTDSGGKQSLVEAAYTQVDPAALTAVAKVLYKGGKKYGRDNWRRIEVEDHLNHLLMHVAAYLYGDSQDEHLEHAATRAVMALAKHLRPDYCGRDC